MELAPGTLIAGRYRLERPLAAGGMGAIWVASHTSLQTELAIKFMASDGASSAAARARFEREGRSAAHLKHINIVAVQDYGIEDDTPYIVMELLRGESLEDRIQRKGRLSADVVAHIVQQMSRGLRKAHEANIVHRDLKPHNVFLARDDDDEEVVKLLDFGIAKQIDMSLGEHTKTSELMGSPHYMSPEQLRSAKKTDVRSDLWSVGVIIYRALTGTVPFPGDTLAEVMVQVFSAKLPPPSSLVKGLPPHIDDFFKRALARNPDDRFQSIRELADAFTAVAAGRPMPTAATTNPALQAPTSTPLPIAPPMQAPIAPPMQVPVAPSSPSLGAPLGQAELRPQTPAPGLSAPPLGAVPGFPEPRAFSASAPNLPAVAPRASHPSFPSPAEIAAAALVPGGPTAPPVTLPTDAVPNATPLAGMPETAPPNPGAFVPGPTPSGPAILPGSNPIAPRQTPAIPLPAVVGGGAVLMLLLVVLAFVALKPSGDPRDGATPLQASTAPPSTSTAEPAPTPALSTLTPDEMAAAVPDETPVEVVPDEPAAPSTKQARGPGWKPIPKGHARLLVTGKGGPCKVTINGSYLGQTPVDVVVEAGKQRIFCRMPTGSTRSKELRAPEYKMTKVEFEVKQ